MNGEGSLELVMVMAGSVDGGEVAGWRPGRPPG